MGEIEFCVLLCLYFIFYKVSFFFVLFTQMKSFHFGFYGLYVVYVLCCTVMIYKNIKCVMCMMSSWPQCDPTGNRF
uniref:Uncharacterized protein n=1 Tax=Anguilla anguilla TaxID=7936 RepID=A0A0E9WS32_ANGAN